ncbi:alpha/beta hydrolase family protein [Actinokineospora pegani]|uniref:alpha/beta hydrolase family protein n=1 Tax=Actinokineospora pegani TaxID=2654637 RepID=UPI0012E9D9F3|nr:alpha/beta hydrolase [Actinokineospora pegani]
MRPLAYGGHPAQVVELTEPDTRADAVVLLVHGGYWRARHGLELSRPLVPSLVAAGFAVANTGYRRVGDGGGWPTSLDDVAAARAALGGDRPVFAVGHSAGGQLAVCLAKRGAVAGVVCLAGVLDVVAAARQDLGEGATRQFLGGHPDDLPDTYAAASPLALAPIGVPVTCVHAADDDRVPIAQSTAFTELTGDRLVTLATGGHFAFLDPDSQAWAVAIEEISRLAGSSPS